ELMDSKVEWRPASIYDLDPDDFGTFDVVVCGSLMLHLRDPLRALEAVRSVTAGHFLSSEQIEASLTTLAPKRPLFQLNGSGGDCQWFNFNAAGHERLLYAAGFAIEKRSRPYNVRFNDHPQGRHGLKAKLRSLAVRRLTGSSADGVLHQALLG